MKQPVTIIPFMFTLNTSASELSFLSYNKKNDDIKNFIYGRNNRKDFLISQLNYNHPDIFGIQEGLHHPFEDIKTYWCAAAGEKSKRFQTD